MSSVESHREGRVVSRAAVRVVDGRAGSRDRRRSPTALGGPTDTGSVEHDSCVMRNVTITLEERVAAWARVRAAQRDQSLSRFLSELLEQQMDRHEAYEGAMHAFLAEKPTR